MKTVGLITEYNPFHNGHLYHLRKSLEVTNANAAVAVMSGHFLQRGEAALVDKWSRTAMALSAGVDLVIELPLPWACNSAPVFAEGGLRALSEVGVDSICFGSESGELDSLQACADLLDRNSLYIADETRKRLRKGENYPQARAAIAMELAEDNSVAEILIQPNNILGIEYLRALNRMQTTIAPHTVHRIGAGYHELEAVDMIASATGIRKMLADSEPVSAFVPEGACGRLQKELIAGRTPDENVHYRLLVQALQQNPEWLKSFYQVTDGMENRLHKAAQTANSFQELIDAGKSKHLTRTRVQRLLVYILLGLEAGLMAEFLDCGPLYLHLLGQNQKGDAVLASCRKDTDIPLVGNYSRIRSILTHRYGKGSEKLRLAHAMLAWEIKATRTYTLIIGKWQGGNRNLDFFNDVIRAD